MSLTPVTVSGDGVFLDVVEAPNAIATFGSYTRRGYAQGFSALAGGLLSISAGTAAVIARRSGRLVREWTSVANTIGSVASVAFPWPVGNDWSAYPPTLRYPTRWCFEGMLVRTNAIGTTSLTFGVQFAGASVTQPLNGAVFTTTAGIHVGSNAALNNGRWSVGVGHLTGVGPTVTTDTGIAASTPVGVRVFYEDGPVPQAWAEVNGVVCSLVSGITNVPTLVDAAPATTKFTPYCVQGDTGVGGAGVIDRLSQVRVWAQDLGDVY